MPKRVVEQRRLGKLVNDEPYNLNFSPDISKMIKPRSNAWRTCNVPGEIRNACKIPFEKSEAKRPTEIPNCDWKNNIKICKKILCEDVE
jgi:hypothetical protein